MNEAKNIINKPFFGKNSCFKVQVNSEKDCYIHVGKCSEENKEWQWEKAKMNSAEIGQMMALLKSDIDKVSIYHKFQDKQKQIGMNRKEDTVFFQINSFSKALNLGEQHALLSILNYIAVNDAVEAS